MTSFAASSLQLIRRLFGSSSQLSASSKTLSSTASLIKDDSTASNTVLDGLTAVSLTESYISQSAALAATFPATTAARVWNARLTNNKNDNNNVTNKLGQTLTAINADNPRSAIASAFGMAVSGQRAACFVSGPDLLTSQDLLAHISGQHAPLVLHLACRADAKHAQSLGTGHTAYYAAGEQGWILLFAQNVQQAVDFTLISRHITERALIPVLVAMDGEQTALAAQNVILPGDELVKQYIGDPAQRINCPTPAQEMLFGKSRRLIPRMYDLEKPLMLSPLQGPESWAVGAAGNRQYFASHANEIINQAFTLYENLTGRKYTAVDNYNVENNPQLILIAQGATVETAKAVANWYNHNKPDHSSTKVGVIGINSLCPFPGAEIIQSVKGTKVVAVLERADSTLSFNNPLIREIRAALDMARENAQFNIKTHAAFNVAIPDNTQPQIVSVPCGTGGCPLHAADLIQLINQVNKSDYKSRIYPGIEFAQAKSQFPKRQAMLDVLRRNYPDTDNCTINSSTYTDVRPAGATTIAIHRLIGSGNQQNNFDSFAGEAAQTIYNLLGGQIRTRPALSWQNYDQPGTDYLTHVAGNNETLLDPGDDVEADIAVLLIENPAAVHPCMNIAKRLSNNAVILLAGWVPAENIFAALPVNVQNELQSKNIEVYWVNVKQSDNPYVSEVLLGGLASLIAARHPQLPSSKLTAAKVAAARESLLANLPDKIREQKLALFTSAYESVQKTDHQLTNIGIKDADITTPLAVRHLSRSDTTLNCLPRFWDQVGILYRTNTTDTELSADPYMATGAVPPLTSTFRDVSAAGNILPALDPATCNGHGKLWTTCPDASIVPLVISGKSLIDTGMNLATDKGHAVSDLNSIAGKLARSVNKIIAENNVPPVTAKDLLQTAFDSLMEKSSDSADRKKTLKTALDAVLQEIGELPLIRTTVFFDDLEKTAKGTGELFSLIVNPDACKGAAVTLNECKGIGLVPVAKTPDNIALARRLWNLWQLLPDTSGDTIERVKNHPDVGPLAAIMLSKHCITALAGGDGSEAGSGARLALHNTLALIEYHLQPRIQNHLNQIESLRTQLAAKIRDLLADALPVKDLNALADGLKMLGRKDVDISELSSRVDTAISGGRVDGAKLGRLVEVARGLADLHWRLAKGIDGLGRARTGITIASGSVASWTGVFPYNPFSCPVMLDAAGTVSSLAQGLLEGQLNQAVAGIRLLRWAKMEIEKPNEAAHAAEELAKLRYSDLTPEESILCPPMLIVGDAQSLGGKGLSQLISTLDSSLPIKILVLNDIGGAADQAGLGVDTLGCYPDIQNPQLALLALFNRKAYVTQTSLANQNHFVNSVMQALAFAGPALIHIHTPSPTRHGFAVEQLHKQAELAVASRAFPQFTYNPELPGAFGNCLNLDNNPDAGSLLCKNSTGKTVTPLDWAVTEKRFAQYFTKIDPAADAAPTSAADYLMLSKTDRQGKTPYIFTASPDNDELIKLKVDAELIKDADNRLRLWKTLQEFAGVVTPFTQQVKQQLENELAQNHANELAQLENFYKDKIAQLQTQFETQATIRIKNRLMELAGYKVNDNGRGDAT